MKTRILVALLVATFATSAFAQVDQYRRWVDSVSYVRHIEQIDGQVARLRKVLSTKPSKAGHYSVVVKGDDCSMTKREVEAAIRDLRAERKSVRKQMQNRLSAL